LEKCSNIPVISTKKVNLFFLFVEAMEAFRVSKRTVLWAKNWLGYINHRTAAYQYIDMFIYTNQISQTHLHSLINKGKRSAAFVTRTLDILEAKKESITSLFRRPRRD
jgi:hypothetical protein